MVMMRIPGPIGVNGRGRNLDNFPGPGGFERAGQQAGVLHLLPTGVFPLPSSRKRIQLLDFLDRASEALKHASRERRAKKFNMPSPATVYASGMTAMIKEVTRPLFHGKGNKARPEDVVQQGAANCALASILAALAHTPKGRVHISSMIKELAGLTLTSYQGRGDFNPFDGDRKVFGERYFSLTLPGTGKTIDVSDAFFTNDSEPPHRDMIFMDSGAPKVLWASLIEKAYADFLGGYDNFSDVPSIVWKHVLGQEPKFLSLQEGTQNFASDQDVIRQAGKAGSQPMIAAIMGKVGHGEAVMGVSGKRLVLYDPFKGRTEQLSVSNLRGKLTVFYYTAL